MDSRDRTVLTLGAISLLALLVSLVAGHYAIVDMRPVDLFVLGVLLRGLFPGHDHAGPVRCQSD